MKQNSFGNALDGSYPQLMAMERSPWLIPVVLCSSAILCGNARVCADEAAAAEAMLKVSEKQILTGKGGSADELAKIVADDKTPARIYAVARRALVSRLLEEGKDLTRAEAELAKATRDEAADPAILNLQLELLCAKVGRVESAQQAAVWAKEIAGIRSADALALAPRTLKALDDLVTSLGVSQPGFSARVLVDVMTLTPDGASMAWIQGRRLRLYSRQKNFGGAAGTAAVDIALAVGGRPGVLAALERDRAEMNKAGAGMASEALPHALMKGAAARLVDQDLKDAAGSALDAPGASFSARRRAWLLAFAGRSTARDAIEAMVAATTAEASAVDGVVTEAAMMLAIEQGCPRALRSVNGLNQQQSKASSTERAKQQRGPSTRADSGAVLLRDVSAALRTRLIRRACSVINGRVLDEVSVRTAKATDADAVLSLCAAALESSADDELPRRADAMSGVMGGAKASAAADFLTRAAALISEPRKKRLVLMQAARLLLDAGDSKACLKQLEQISGSPSTRWTSGRSVTAELLRARALIEQRQYLEALAVVERVDPSISGEAAEDRAAVSFLKGWLYLQNDDVPSGLMALGAVVDDYPGTRAAGAAARAIRRYRGTAATTAKAR